jgi:hypothetical protein
MNGPSVYPEPSAKTEGIATFDDPYTNELTTGGPNFGGVPANWQARWMLDCKSTYDDRIHMPDSGTSQGYSGGMFSGGMNSGGIVTTRLQLTADCPNPLIGLHQHESSDSSINGRYVIYDDGGSLVASTNGNEDLCNQNGCSSSGNCWCPDVRMGVVLKKNKVYHIGACHSVCELHAFRCATRHSVHFLHGKFDVAS